VGTVVVIWAVNWISNEILDGLFKRQGALGGI
jgi:hypothetical protein